MFFPAIKTRERKSSVMSSELISTADEKQQFSCNEAETESTNICPPEGQVKVRGNFKVPDQPRAPRLREKQTDGKRCDLHTQGDADETECSNVAALDMAGVQEVIKLPQTFLVKFLGNADASGLWGIKFTRKPVDELVAAAKALKPQNPLPLVKLEVSISGIKMSLHNSNDNETQLRNREFNIDTISYGVQDLVYTRVFAMIVVSEDGNVFQNHPFRCFAFVCDSRSNARRLTLALAKAFQEFSLALKAVQNGPGSNPDEIIKPKRFAIDLRSSDELERDLALGNSEDSEA